MRFIVSGHSMEPTFKPGQTLLVSSIPYWFREPKVGDVVVIKDPRDGRLLLKRITKITSPSPHTFPSREREFLLPLWEKVRMRGNEQYFIAGDNPKESTDSRTFGSVEKRNILGKIFNN